MDADEPLLATPENVAETTELDQPGRADGGTNPLPALLFALSLRPDAIYFLSDGQFDPGTIQELRSATARICGCRSGRFRSTRSRFSIASPKA